MKKIIASKWFAAAIGVVLFLVTVLLFPSSQPTKNAKQTDGGTNNVPETAAKSENGEGHESKAPAHEDSKPIVNLATQAAPLSTQVGEPGSMTFNNPEVTKLITELRQERVALATKERELKELQRRLDLEKAEIGSITQEVVNFKMAVENALTNGFVVIRKEEEKRLKQLAGIYINMPASNAVVILDKMSVDEVAKVLEYMKEKEKAAILENFATNSNVLSGKATEISDRIRKMVPEPQLPAFQK